MTEHVPVLEGFNRWLDKRPRTRFAGRVLASVIIAAALIIVAGFAGAIAGVVLFFLVMTLWSGFMGPGSVAMTDLDVWVRGAWIMAIATGLSAGVVVLIRLASLAGRKDRRTRADLVRALVSQAIVSHRQGDAVRRLSLGLLGGGTIEYTRDVGASDDDEAHIEALRRELGLLIAGLSRTEPGFWRNDPHDLMSKVTETAGQIMTFDALRDVEEAIDMWDEIRLAAEFVDDALRRIPEKVRNGLEHELRTAGSMRARRFEDLLARGRIGVTPDGENVYWFPPAFIRSPTHRGTKPFIDDARLLGRPGKTIPTAIPLDPKQTSE